jgi:hypothetical protein
MTRLVLLPFTLEVPFWSGIFGFEHQEFPLLGGLFRACAPVSSNAGVKSWG